MNNKCENIIKLDKIEKKYIIGTQEVSVLKNICMSVSNGEFLSIMGASGTGKSTLMNIMGCLDKPTSGSYLLDGNEVSDLSEDELAYTRNRKIGFVFQGFNLLPRLSALNNVILPTVYGGTYKQDRKARAIKILEGLGLKDRIHHMPSELSGGQKQRVAIARALMNDPAIIMADEPTGNLDSHSTKEVMEVFSQLNELGKTLILVTHEDDVAEYAKRHIILSDGEIYKDLRGSL